MINRIFVELQIKTLTDKMVEYERWLKYTTEEKTKKEIKDKITALEVERELYIRLL